MMMMMMMMMIMMMMMMMMMRGRRTTMTEMQIRNIFATILMITDSTTVVSSILFVLLRPVMITVAISSIAKRPVYV